MARIIKAQLRQPCTLLRGSACALGVFDGVHLGHRFLIEQARQEAALRGGATIALTFDRDPDELFCPHTLRKLMSNDARLDMLASLSIDAVVVLPFTPEFAALSPEAFLQEVFADTRPQSLHVGKNFRFGAAAQGDVATLMRWGAEEGSRIFSTPLIKLDGDTVSASRIRSLLAAGDIANANTLLGRRFFVDGKVLHGRGAGAGFGFKTANLYIPAELQSLSAGVYAAWAELDGRCYKAAVSVGRAPSFCEEVQANCEVHLLNFEGNLYGKQLRVHFDTWLRPMIAFSSTDELIATVKSNIAWVQRNLSDVNLP